MGWAKYYEDNISICNDRLFMALTPEIVHYTPMKHNPVEEKKENGIAQQRNAYVPCPWTREYSQENRNSSRRGLELRFQGKATSNFSRKLQLNGWWWSPSGECWCNSNTPGNRKYAQNIIIAHNGELSFNTI